MRVAFHTLGCKVNHYETEAMREAFVSRGAVSVGEEDPADVYIINTCTVTNIADRKSRQYIRRVRRVNPDALIVVTGCYAQVEPEEVASMPEVDIVVGNGRKATICDLVLDTLAERTSGKHNLRQDISGNEDDDSDDINNADPATDADYMTCGKAEAEIFEEQEGYAVTEGNERAKIIVLPRAELTEYENMGLVASSEPGMTRAYIKIQEGCDRFCAYCLIPYARGPVRSRPPEEILSEAAMLLDSGVRELVLTGINTALYGTEKGFAYDLDYLLAKLDEIEMPEGDDFRIRLSSLEPTVVDKDHVEKIIRYRRLCHHLHLSVQAGSDHILRSMNRHYTRDDYLDIVRAIREYDPLYGITTDIIVGFPGETGRDFDDSLDIVRKASFGKVHVFRYSPRKGTPGASLPDAVPGEVKNKRADILEQVASETAHSFMKANTEAVHTILAEEIQDGYMTGYTDNYIKVYVEDPGKRMIPGRFYKVRLSELFREGCKASLDL